MKDLKSKLIVLGIFGAGLVTGLLRSKSEYYQGRIDSADEFKELLKKAKEEVISKKEE